MHPDPVSQVRFSTAEVRPSTKWIFVEAGPQSGFVRTGEGALSGREDMGPGAAKSFAAALLNRLDLDPRDLEPPMLPALHVAAAYFASDQALWDIIAQRHGSSLAAMLGDKQRHRVPVYANINRRTLDRSPAGFSESARVAIGSGYSAVKKAPFDEATAEVRRAGG